MTFRLFRLHFKSGLHLSKGKEGNYDRSQLTIHSDTLKSALFVAALQLYGKAVDKASFLDQFKISSAFPFCELGGQFLYFLPRPMISLEKIQLIGIHFRRQKKLLKNIQYIEKGLLEKLLHADQREIILSQKHFSSKGNLIAASPDLQKEQIIKRTGQQHVQIARIPGNDNEPFFIDKMFFSPNAGLYFLLQIKDENNFRFSIDALLSLLEDSGLATDRNSGGGQFEFKEDKNGFTWPEISKPKKQINLSLYLPTQSELSPDATMGYQLMRRGGYIASPANPAHISIRKKSVYMFAEGSTFPYDINRQGRVIDLKPDDQPLIDSGITPLNHPVWRDGQAIFLPSAI